MASYYLAHHGILGQKWGIRRYQNYDGTYTQQGLSHYNKSKEKYESSKAEYERLKKSGASSQERAAAKSQMQTHKQNMNKNYKQLKKDYVADKGKERYKNGETINGKRAVNSILVGIGGVAISVTTSMPLPVEKKYATAILAGGLGLVAIASLKATKEELVDYNQLRAYYGHSAKYYD